MKKTYKLAELAKKSGTPPRTIRFYIARGILPGPVQAGRAAVYEQRHLDGLKHIAEWKQRGLTLAEIGARVNGDVTAPRLPAASEQVCYSVAPEVTVTVRSDIAPWRMNRIKAAVAELAERLNRENDDDLKNK